MTENTDHLEAWCSNTRQLLRASGQTSSEDFSALLQHIRAHVRRSLLAPDGVANVNPQTPLAALPDCLIRQILLHTELCDRLALAATCKCLRDRCDALNVLLPSIRVQPVHYWEAQRPRASSLERAISVARQSHPRDLESVALTWWPELSGGVSRFLSENMARMHSLRIFFPSSIAQRPRCAAALFEALATPAPALTDLHLVVDARLRTRAFTFDVAIDPLDGQRLSALRRLRVSGMRLTLLPGLVFADLREFCWFHGAPATLDRGALVSLVACMPRLETLRIRSGWVSWDADALPLRSSLRHVHVDECSEIAKLPAFLAGTHIELLTLTRPSPKTADKALLETLARASVSASYSFLFCEFIAQPPPSSSLAGRPQQVIRYVTAIPPFKVARRRFVASFRHMTSLTLLELFWPCAQKSAAGSCLYASGRAIALPALTRLCVSLAPCRTRLFLDDSTPGGVLLGLGDALAPLQTHALQELEISYYHFPGSLCRGPFAWSSRLSGRADCCCRLTLSVSLSDIHRFVSSCIRLPKGRRLEQLRIHGVEVVDPDPFIYLELLEQLATIVSVSSVPKPNSCDLGANLWDVNDEYLRLDDVLSY